MFRAPPEAYRNAVLGTAPRVGLEAAIEQGWREWLRPADAFIGLSDFGVSAPAPAAFAHFGLTADRIAERARNLVGT